MLFDNFFIQCIQYLLRSFCDLNEIDTIILWCTAGRLINLKYYVTLINLQTFSLLYLEWNIMCSLRSPILVKLFMNWVIFLISCLTFIFPLSRVCCQSVSGLCYQIILWIVMFCSECQLDLPQGCYSEFLFRCHTCNTIVKADSNFTYNNLSTHPVD